jgi:hypothetical protein
MFCASVGDSSIKNLANGPVHFHHPDCRPFVREKGAVAIVADSCPNLVS